MNKITCKIGKLSSRTREFMRLFCSVVTVKVIVFMIILIAVSHTVNAAEFDIPAGDVNALVEAINTANFNNEDNTIFLESANYTLTAVNNNSNCGSGLPSITSKIIINGAGAGNTIIERDSNAPGFSIFHVAAGGDLTLNGQRISGGLCTGCFGGGINNDGTLKITNSIISGNYCGVGGGISNGGTLIVTNSTISSNDASPDAGGGINNGGTLIITNSTISGNIAMEGGGIINLPWGTLTITNSTFSGNTNTAIDTFGPVTITNSTIFDNPNAGISNNAGSNTVNLQNSILAGNSPNCVGEVTSLGNNIVGDPTGCTITLQASDLTGDPGLGPFIGGAISGKGHFPLLPNSQAIDTGNNDACTPTDQLGNYRVDGNGDGAIVCDIGAIEFKVQIEAAINIYPKTLNLRSKGKQIISEIRLPEEYYAHNIARVSLEISIPSCSYCEVIYPTCEFPLWKRYLAFFPRQDLIDAIDAIDLALPTKLDIKIAGELYDGTLFEGLDTIRVTNGKNRIRK
jgi:hypothetical protein